MRELLLESKGCLTRRGIFSIVVGVICFVVGLWIAVQSTEVGGYRLSTRLFGGGLTVRNTADYRVCFSVCRCPTARHGHWRTEKLGQSIQ